MHYVKRGTAPKELEQYQKKSTQKWVDYYKNSIGKKPTDSHWTKDEIRHPLVQYFEDNCGYCGIGIGTRRSKVDGKALPIGQVDHFRPKSKCPELVYEWDNLIWSCVNCNDVKGNYYAAESLLFDPCNAEDMQYLELRQDGKYYLKPAFAVDSLLRKRYQATCDNTLINAGERPRERAARKNELENTLNSLEKYYEILQNKNCPLEIKESVQKLFQNGQSALINILQYST
ncbi:MAG: HNH endonuclease [Pseudomonadota bacterium]